MGKSVDGKMLKFIAMILLISCKKRFKENKLMATCFGWLRVLTRGLGGTWDILGMVIAFVQGGVIHV